MTQVYPPAPASGMTRRCMYCLLPLDEHHVGVAHTACLEKQRTIEQSPGGRKMVGNTVQRINRDAVVALIEKNPTMPYKTIAARYGVSPQWVSLVATDAGIRRKGGPAAQLDRMRIAEELANGTPVKTIAHTMGCSFQLVYRLRAALAL